MIIKQGVCQIIRILKIITNQSVELNKKKALDADPKAIQQIVFQGVVLVYRIDLYFHKHKLAIEVDELGHADRNLSNETGRQKALEK